MSSETKQWLIEIVLLVLAVIALASAPAGPGSAASADPGAAPPAVAARH
jgi:hypothetical protein